MEDEKEGLQGSCRGTDLIGGLEEGHLVVGDFADLIEEVGAVDEDEPGLGQGDLEEAIGVLATGSDRVNQGRG